MRDGRCPVPGCESRTTIAAASRLWPSLQHPGSILRPRIAQSHAHSAHRLNPSSSVAKAFFLHLKTQFRTALAGASKERDGRLAKHDLQMPPEDQVSRLAAHGPVARPADGFPRSWECQRWRSDLRLVLDSGRAGRACAIFTRRPCCPTARCSLQEAFLAVHISTPSLRSVSFGR